MPRESKGRHRLNAYPPANWKALYAGVGLLLAELDRYLTRFERWAAAEGILEA